MKNIVNETVKALTSFYESILPSEEQARKIGANYVAMYGMDAKDKDFR